MARSTSRAARATVEPVTVSIIGLGYVGLTTALALLERGIKVVAYDKSRDRLEAVAGATDGLPDAERIRLAGTRANLRLVDNPLAPTLSDVDVVLICVPTPVDDHQVPDLEPLRSACELVVLSAKPGQTIVLTSTTYVGCTRDLLIRPLEDRGLVVGEDVFVAFSPERVDPGNTQFPQERVPRIVGGATPQCTARATKVMDRVAAMIEPVSTPEAAELAKLFENTFRAVNIALANELADVSKSLDIDVIEVIDAAATKPYGFMPFFPGPGVGGHCIPVDPHYLLWQLKARRVGAPLIDKAMTLIAERPGHAIQRAVEMLADKGTPVAGARILISGVAYKPGVSDVRGSPALEILSGLRARGAEVEYFDRFVPQIRVGSSVLRSVEEISPDYDLVVLHTVHGTDAEADLASCPALLDLTFRSGVGTHAGTL
jgi:nucleotide sugar dehydrogenase